MRNLLLAALVGLWVGGCAHAESAGARKVSMSGARTINQAELQQDIQRFAATATERITQAANAAMTEAPVDVRPEVVRRVLRYLASILDIATGPFPEVNLLDMLAFNTLVQDSLEEHWMPEVFKEAGEPLARAFARSEKDLHKIAAKVISPGQQQEVRRIIEDWRRQNPLLHEVEGVRLFSFGEIAGEVSAERARQARGLLAAVKVATQSADQALLLAERTMFLAQRLPFTLRLQARLGAQEILSDSLESLGQADQLIERASGLQPLVIEAAALVEKSRRAASEARDLVDALDPLLPILTEGKLERVLSSANQLTDKSLVLLEEAKMLVPQGEDAPAAILERVDRLVRRWLVGVAIVGVLLIGMFWAGYIVAKQTAGASSAHRREASVSLSERSAGQPPGPGASDRS